MSSFLRILSDFLSKFLEFLSLNINVFSASAIFIFTIVLPSSFNIFKISSTSFWDFTLNKTSLIGLLNSSFKDPIFCTLIRLNLFSSLEMFLIRVNIREFPSIKISRFNSKMSENINNSKTLFRSVNFKTAYAFPFAVFLSCNFNKVAAIFASLISSLELKLE